MQPDFEHQDFFSCSMDDLDIVKGGSNKEEDTYRMQGFASAPNEDFDKDTILQKGLNPKPLLARGWVNYDHDRRELIGWPEKADFRKHPKLGTDCFHAQYKLTKGVPLADKVWKTAVALEKNNAPRRYGLSIEGIARDRNPAGIITRADVIGLAVTPYAKNYTTSASVILKGILNPNMDIKNQNYPFLKPKCFNLEKHEIIDENMIHGLYNNLYETLYKALSAGHSYGSTDQTNGASMRKEDIDKNKKSKEIDSISLDLASLTRFDEKLFKGCVANIKDKKLLKACEYIKGVAEERNGYLTKGEAAFFSVAAGYPIKEVIKGWGLDKD